MEYTPKKQGENILFAVALKKCFKCGKDMVSRPPTQSFEENTFPVYYRGDFDAQANRAGLVIQSRVRVDYKYICEKCVKEDRADFLCSLCGKRHLSSEKQLSIGLPPEYLCKTCYKTVSAKRWKEKINDIENDHMYDFG